jgi:D-alanyl-D-alanine carboxypeptidase/D-alanyl-D-alanine-endopeptidase (penicillin-binding protein 4)
MLRVVLVIVLAVVAAGVGGFALYASTSDESGGTTTAGAAATPAPSTPTASIAPTPRATPSPAASAPPAVPALWEHAASPAAPLLVPVSLDAGPDPTTAGLSATLAPLLADKAFAGDSVAMLVADPSGHVLFSHAAGTLVPPASTAKLAVAVAALQILGPDHRFSTSVRKGPAPGEIVLVGGGDPTLTGPAAVGALSPGYPTPASLVALASTTVEQLRAQGVTTVSLGYDASLFTGPQLAAGWKPIYQTEGDVAPVSALEVDEGAQVLTRPGRVANPASAAAAEFAALLTADGLTVTGVPQSTKAPATPVTVASVASPPLSQLVQRMLGQSDNDLAEALARQVAIATGRPASFTGGAAAVKAAVAQLGVEPSGLAMVDASGLSPLDRVQPLALTQLLRLAVVPGDDRLASILTGLPVGGFSGTLSGRFGGQAVAGAGVIRAKTGTLDGVVALAGYLQDSGGATLVFVTIATGVAKTAGTATETAVDRMTASLPTCGCR